MSFFTSLRNFIEIGPPSAEKNDVMAITGSLKSQGTTCYRSSVDTIALNYLVFDKIVFFCIFHCGQTDEQMNSTDALSRSRCRERRLNK